MKIEAAKKNLESIFWNAVLDENYFFGTKKMGINFNQIPDTESYKEIAVKFYEDASARSWLYAKNALNGPINVDLVVNHRITLDFAKIVYSQSLSVLKHIEFLHKLQANPHNLDALIKNYQESQTTLVKVQQLPEVIENFILKNEERLKSGNFELSLSSFPILSELIAGFNESRVTIITAPTGFGKSNLALNLLSSAIKDKINCLYINMEMDIDDIAKRFLQINYSLTKHDFKKPDYIQKITSNSEMWMSKAINNFITDGRSLPIDQISGLIAEKKREADIKIVLIDYDQKIESNSNDEEWRIIQKSVHSLEETAKREKVHVILFSQANSEKDGIPRSSVRAMQPASSVIYFHKEDNEFLLTFLKNRFGPCDKKIIMDYQPEKSIIKEIRIKEKEVMPKPQKPVNFYRGSND